MNWRTVLPVIFAVIGSRDFLVWLGWGWVCYYVVSAIWMSEVFAFFINGLSRNLIMQIPFVLFLVSSLLNLIRFGRAMLGRGMRHCIAALLLPCGVFLFLFGFFISIVSRQFEWIPVKPGDIVKISWSGEQYRVQGIDLGLKERILDIDLESGLGLFRYEPVVVMEDRQARHFRFGAFPPLRVGSSYFHVLQTGLSPFVRFFEAGVLQLEGYVQLRLLPAGSADSFTIDPAPYKFVVRLSPEQEFEKGGIKASQYNMVKPLYHVRVFREATLLTEGTSSAPLRFDNYGIEFLEPAPWVLLEVVRDPGVPVLLGGLLLGLLGAPLSLAAFLIRKLK